MTREEHLKYCSTCKNQVKDSHKGIICGITGTYADFDDSCSFYKEDAEQKEIIENTAVQKEIILSTVSKSKRFANHLLDTFFFYIIAMIIGLIIGFTVAYDNPDALDNLNSDNIFLQYLIGFIAGFIYYATAETLTGRTPAKYITKTRVINMDGERPDLQTVLLRTLCRFIPFDALSFLFTEETGWHDRLSGTRVVNTQ